MGLQKDKATGSRISGSRQPKKQNSVRDFINYLLSSPIFEVKKTEIQVSVGTSFNNFKERAYLG